MAAFLPPAIALSRASPLLQREGSRAAGWPMRPRWRPRQHPSQGFDSLPRWGRAGVGARRWFAGCGALAPIPTFPQRGKGLSRAICQIVLSMRACVGAGLPAMTAFLPPAIALSRASPLLQREGSRAAGWPMRPRWRPRQHPSQGFDSLPRWGRAGVGARRWFAGCGALAPIPTFPQRGKGLSRAICQIVLSMRACVGAGLPAMTAFLPPAIALSRASPLLQREGNSAAQ